MQTELYFSEVVYDHWSFYILANNNGLIFVGSSPKNKEELEGWVSRLPFKTTLARDDQKLFLYIQQFEEYLSKKRENFTFPVELIGTPFQIMVWKALLGIPYGQTVTYSDIAATLNKGATHSRAVGTAIGKNPLQIVYPCHRVGPKNGAPRGFRGGLPMKMDLLELEGNK
ncbi:methylated-DNA--[protein]-cysteine S-methyltransferase [Marinilactibacillus sp. Marseille-P9653]|uniref:methylated-DNA--[protein]-cysteine S-methyltransferase n=1 Tax=Marinilactibacillus sp. Marseille-P9653 TaxID=2866583 RepID=UPI001CE45DA5|nr:methylated-DNA--[protein]-cysteine S-methyltransferase [Marinilactibacillus sp. Marseille-P9653]